MICVSLSEKDFKKCRRLVSELEFCEIRLDLCGFTIQETKEIFSTGKPLIATFRPDGIPEEKRVESLITAIEAGADYVDIEYDSPEESRLKICETARKNNCAVILSYHNYDLTPEKDELRDLLLAMLARDADIIKIACEAKDYRDNVHLIALYDMMPPDKQLIAVGMGEHGQVTRLAAPLLGAPFTFASYTVGIQIAPGQLDYITMQRMIDTIRGE